MIGYNSLSWSVYQPRMHIYLSFHYSLLVMSNMLSMLSKDETIETMLASAVGLLSEDVIKEVSLNQMNMIDRLLSQLLL